MSRTTLMSLTSPSIRAAGFAVGASRTSRPTTPESSESAATASEAGLTSRTTLMSLMSPPTTGFVAVAATAAANASPSAAFSAIGSAIARRNAATEAEGDAKPPATAGLASLTPLMSLTSPSATETGDVRGVRGDSDVRLGSAAVVKFKSIECVVVI